MNIRMQLSLIPAAKLNAALVYIGVDAKPTRVEAINACEHYINQGGLTLELCKQIQPLKMVQAGATADPMIVAQINDAVISATTAEANVNSIRADVDNLLNKIVNDRQLVNEAHRKLTDDIEAKLQSITGVDYTKVNNEIRAAIASQFDAFKQVTPVERIQEIAAVIPATTLKKAKELFGDICKYVVDGETVDFGDMEIEYWGDVNAPKMVDDYVFNPVILHQALVALSDELPDNCWLAGERGTGKTEFASQIAARLGRRLFRINFDEALERADFIGGNSIDAGSVVWKAGIITQAIQYAGAIILLDEIGFARAQSIAVLHSLCERSPHRALTVSETGQRIPVASHVVFFCADNSNGYGNTSGNFTGVREMNSAFIDRFSYTLQFDYLPPKKETDLIVARTGLPFGAAELIVKLANTAREKARAGLLTQPPSLRQLFAWARAIKKGLPIKTAYENAVINKYPAECESELQGIYIAVIDAAKIKQYLVGV